MNNAQAILELRDVGKTFHTPPAPPREVLRGIRLSVLPGEFLTVTGPSGAGKTTLLHLMALLEPPSEGHVLFEGADTATLSEADRAALRAAAIGMVFQRFCLLPFRSALDNVLFRFRYMDTPAAERRRRAEAALRETGLADLARVPARLLSAGEMQRVAVARAAAAEPRLLLADEPTGNLDPDSARRIMELFQTLNRRGMTIIMVTHNKDLLPFGTRHLECSNGGLT